MVQKANTWLCWVIGQQVRIRCNVMWVTLLYWVQEVSVCIGTVICWDQHIIVRKITNYLEYTHSPFVEQLPTFNKL